MILKIKIKKNERIKSVNMRRFLGGKEYKIGQQREKNLHLKNTQTLLEREKERTLVEKEVEILKEEKGTPS